MSIAFIVVGVIVMVAAGIARFICGNLAEGERGVEIDLRRKDRNSLDGWELQQLANASIDAQQHKDRAGTATILIFLGGALTFIGIGLIFHG
jgi:hypothetical protein